MDYYAVKEFHLPIELMMENAGLQLARLVASSSKSSNEKILIGVGNGNNGGGGLVAARRLAAWGFEVYLDMPSSITKDLPGRQLERALTFGAQQKTIEDPDIWVDAYLGFSQKLPLSNYFNERVLAANQLNCTRISLDIPTGFLGDIETLFFQADNILTLAAAKKILYSLPISSCVYIADLGIPSPVYQKFGLRPLPFDKSSILLLERE